MAIRYGQNAPDTQFVDERRRITQPWLAWLTQTIKGMVDTVIDVAHGGTGRSSLTAHDVLVGNGTNPVTLVSPSTAGYVLTSNGTGSDPSFQAVPAGGDVTHTGTLTSGKLIQGNGGADITVNATTATVTKLTAGTPSAATAGTDYTDAAFKTIQVSGQSDVIADSPADTLTLAAGSGVTITTNAGTDTVTIAATGSGGTVTHTGTLTANQLVYGNGTADIKTVAATDGQIPIGKTSDGTAAFATLTAGSNITVTNAANSITIAAAGATSAQVVTDTRTSNGDFSTTYTIAGNSVAAGDVFDYLAVGTETVGTGAILQYKIKAGSVDLCAVQGYSFSAGSGTFVLGGTIWVVTTGATGKGLATLGVSQSRGLVIDNVNIGGPWKDATPLWPYLAYPAATATIDWTASQAITLNLSGVAGTTSVTLTNLIVRKRV